MKKIIIAATAATILVLGTLCLVGCSSKSEVPDKTVSKVSDAGTSVESSSSNSATSPNAANTAAFLLDSGGVDDSLYSKQIWNGVQAFQRSHTDYQVKNYAMTGDGTQQDHADLLAKAIGEGASVIVCPGDTYASLMADTAAANPNVSFLVVDASPTDADGDVTSAENVYSYTFDDAQAGYLAGYALAKEGYRGLGFAGGVDVNSVKAYGSGFVQGANAAAVADDVATDTYMAYWYTGTFTASDSVQSEIQRWYENGVDVTFSCGGGIAANVTAAAASTNKKCVMADADGSSLSSTVVCSATKNLSGSVSDALGSLAENGGTWNADHAGKSAKLGLAENGVALTCGKTWTLTKFTQADYDALVAAMKNGTVTVDEGADVQQLDTAIQVDVK